MKAVLNRTYSNDKQTLGHLTLYDGYYEVFSCYTLELPDKNNQNFISRIPPGKYTVKKRNSKKYKTHFHILDVPGRDYILIHIGNYNSDIKGCIVVGQSISDINKDGEMDVASSGITMKKFVALANNNFELIINELEQ